MLSRRIQLVIPPDSRRSYSRIPAISYTQSLNEAEAPFAERWVGIRPPRYGLSYLASASVLVSMQQQVISEHAPMLLPEHAASFNPNMSWETIRHIHYRFSLQHESAWKWDSVFFNRCRPRRAYKYAMAGGFDIRWGNYQSSGFFRRQWALSSPSTCS